MDRDPKFTQAFRGLLRGEGIKSIRLPPRSPNLNAYIERFFGSLKPECLDRLILFGERSLRNTVREYLADYHTERNHQGLDNELIVPLERPPDTDASIEATERLGGLLRSYRRAA
jgi:putative transposase